jgi:thymidine phosphorylase
VSYFSAVDVITTKRDDGVLSDDAIAWILDAYMRGDVAEEQMSALLMAIFFNGLNGREMNTWTDRMIASTWATCRDRPSTSIRRVESATRSP